MQTHRLHSLEFAGGCGPSPNTFLPTCQAKLGQATNFADHPASEFPLQIEPLPTLSLVRAAGGACSECC
jgi:hypothetical protein